MECYNDAEEAEDQRTVPGCEYKPICAVDLTPLEGTCDYSGEQSALLMGSECLIPKKATAHRYTDRQADIAGFILFRFYPCLEPLYPVFFFRLDIGDIFETQF